MQYSEEIENLENKLAAQNRNLVTLKKLFEDLYKQVQDLEEKVNTPTTIKKKNIK